MSLDVFRGHDELAIELEAIVKGHDVGMSEAGVDADLAKKAVACFGVSGGGARQSAKSFELSRRAITDFVSDAGFGLIDDTEVIVRVGGPGRRKGHTAPVRC